MTNEQMEAVRASVRAAFAGMTSADIKGLVKEPYAEFRNESVQEALVAA